MEAIIAVISHYKVGDFFKKIIEKYISLANNSLIKIIIRRNFMIKKINFDEYLFYMFHVLSGIFTLNRFLMSYIISIIELKIF